jgi:hypothetical protein
VGAGLTVAGTGLILMREPLEMREQLGACDAVLVCLAARL